MCPAVTTHEFQAGHFEDRVSTGRHAVGRCGMCRAKHAFDVQRIVSGPYTGRERVNGCIVSKFPAHLRCPACLDNRGTLSVAPVRFVRKAKQTKCNGACTGASGHICDCECGGANHGASHMRA